jgi:TetR/AcrR family transcriptional regulator, regulator of cefoperazone and chloramphenicol sensitivity
MGKTDHDTRQRLLEAAKRLFAERGFRKVTVRQICLAAGANLAAVNYHFHDKEGLYRTVFEHGIALIQETTDLSLRAPAEASAEDRLRAFIRTAVERMASRGHDNWLAQIIHHEIDSPTQALDQVVQRAIGPRMRAIALLVSDLVQCDLDDPQVMQGVASIHAQLMLALRPWHAFGKRIHWHHAWTAEDLGRHIADFSVGGLVAIRDARRRAATAPARAQGAQAAAAHPASPLPTSLL